jgi:cytochrome c biogenesis protein
MSIYVGDLGLDSGVPSNVFSLSVHGLEQVAGGTKHPKVELTKEGETVQLPAGLGSVTWDGTKRFASLDVDYNPAQVWILAFALLALAGMIISLLVPRRRVWVRKVAGGFEVGALAKGDDARLERVVEELKSKLSIKVPKKKAK